MPLLNFVSMSILLFYLTVKCVEVDEAVYSTMLETKCFVQVSLFFFFSSTCAQMCSVQSHLGYHLLGK